MRVIENLTDTISVLLLAGLISVSTNISEQQKTDATDMQTDKDYSTNNINEHKNNKNLVIIDSSAASNDDIDFTSIFDGKTLNGWKMAGEGKFVLVESDAALQSEGGMGLLWYSEKIYKNFILKLEWKHQMRVIIQEYLCASLILMIVQIMQ